MRVCLFIDGLDEFVGDEDLLINTIHVLSHSSGTKVCASSRPEQIFRQGFDASPQLKLQDLNYPDIHKATVERLTPILDAHVSCTQFQVDSLVHQVIEKSQGIFLWAALMTKDLKTGAMEASSIEELEERLECTPETIDGLYKHMLSRLNKAYRRDAARYFHHLLMYQSPGMQYSIALNLLGFACIDEGVSSHHLHQDPRLLQFSQVQEICRRVEIRILTRCAGLVEVDEHAMQELGFLTTEKGYPGVKLAQEGIASFVREVKFINPGPDRGLLKAIRDTAARVVDEIYDVLCYLNTSFNGPTCTMLRKANLDVDHELDSLNIHPFERRLGFATYFGHHDYVTQYMASHKFSQSDVEYILSCAIIGFRNPYKDAMSDSRAKNLLHTLLDYVPLSTDPYMMSSRNSEIVNAARNSKWAVFATKSFYHLETTILDSDPPNALELIKLWKQVITTFLDHDANANADIDHMLTSYGGMIFRETLLASMERIAATARDAASKIQSKEIEGIFRAHGGTSRRKVEGVIIFPNDFIVTEDQSDHLSNLLSLEDLATLRLMHSIPEELATPTESHFEEVAEFVGCFQTGQLARANKRIYGRRA